MDGTGTALETPSRIRFPLRSHSLSLVPSLSPPGRDSSKEMLHRLVMASIENHLNVASVKVEAFVAKMLREFPSREPVRCVFNRAFKTSLRTMKEFLEKYLSPDFRRDHDETEAIQRLNLHSTVYDGKDLLWFLERMIELRIADTALKEWSEETAFVADLQRTFQDDAWRNIAPSLPALMLRCTGRLADAFVTGSILAARQVYCSRFAFVIFYSYVLSGSGFLLLLLLSTFELVYSCDRLVVEIASNV